MTSFAQRVAQLTGIEIASSPRRMFLLGPSARSPTARPHKLLDVVTETEHERHRRERQRVLFDDVAELYDATRRGYPAEIIDSVIGTSGVGPGDSVLEIGCGTGQLTPDLAGRGFSVTAIDIGPTMVSSARRNVGDSSVNFEVTSFEDLRVADNSIDLIASATAFHWIDPELGRAKAARLLRPRGWLALLSTAKQYDDPLRSSLKDVWIRYSDDGGAWATQKKASLPETLAETGLFRGC
jgi:ubiquinone/menaquinone biosynthesis C-methylase UbiE